MSSETTPVTTPETPSAISDTGEAPGEPQNGSETETRQKANKEARYRTERNTARDELAAATARIERMQRAEVERLASDALSHPADLFSLSGNEVSDYLTEDGDVDADKVAADVAAVLAERPGLRKQMPGYDPTQGYGGRLRAKREPTLADLLKGGANQPY